MTDKDKTRYAKELTREIMKSKEMNITVEKEYHYKITTYGAREPDLTLPTKTKIFIELLHKGKRCYKKRSIVPDATNSGK